MEGPGQSERTSLFREIHRVLKPEGVFAASDMLRSKTEAVIEYLASKLGIAPERMIPYGAGPVSPMASNETEEGRAKNRRVELAKQ